MTTRFSGNPSAATIACRPQPVTSGAKIKAASENVKRRERSIGESPFGARSPSGERDGRSYGGSPAGGLVHHAINARSLATLHTRAETSLLLVERTDRDVRRIGLAGCACHLLLVVLDGAAPFADAARQGRAARAMVACCT